MILILAMRGVVQGFGGPHSPSLNAAPFIDPPSQRHIQFYCNVHLVHFLISSPSRLTETAFGLISQSHS